VPSSHGAREFADDDGSADPAVAAALAAFARGAGSERDALTALAGARLLVPIVAREPGPAVHASPGQGAGPAPPGSPARPGSAGHGAELALPTLIGRDGRPAIPAFTSLAALRAWRPGARPVPVAARQVWQAAVQDRCAVVIDVGGPVPIAADGARLAALAAGAPVPWPHEDPDVTAAVAAAAAEVPGIAAARAGPAASGSDLSIQVSVAAGPASRAAASALAGQLAAAVSRRLGGRLRRGIEVAVPGASGPAR
jgi:hypothetical protein